MDELDLQKVLEDWQEEHLRDAMLCSLSHELLDPMTLVMGYSDLLLREGPLEPYQRDWLEIIFRGSQRITAIVRDLLLVVRIQSGDLRVNLRSLTVSEVVSEALTLVNQHHSDYEYAVRIAPEMPEGVADLPMLKRVLEQLLDNAIKFSPKGARVIVSARHEAEQSRVVVTVSDQGVGIAPEDRDKIFAPFRRLQRPETEHIRGAGLGLFIVREMLQHMHGEVWVESELGKGATFSFSLPT